MSHGITLSTDIDFFSHLGGVPLDENISIDDSDIFLPSATPRHDLTRFSFDLIHFPIDKTTQPPTVTGAITAEVLEGLDAYHNGKEGYRPSGVDGSTNGHWSIVNAASENDVLPRYSTIMLDRWMEQERSQDPLFIALSESRLPSSTAPSERAQRKQQPELIATQRNSKTQVLSTQQRQPGLIEIQRFDPHYPGLLLQPDFRPISQEQLASEVKSIYAGLTMVESQCIHVDRTCSPVYHESLQPAPRWPKMPHFKYPTDSPPASRPLSRSGPNSRPTSPLSFSATVPPPRNSQNQRKNSRKALPILFTDSQRNGAVMTGYDTGTEANHISLDLAKELGYSISSDKKRCAKFQLANGKVVESIGQISTELQFAQGNEGGGETIPCFFNVFKTLAVPALMGMAFLNATKTLTKYTSRLVDVPRTWKQSLRVCSIGSTANRVSCVVDGNPVIAYADTGSEIALMNLDYMKDLGVTSSLNDQETEEIMLADGSTDFTCGYVDVDFNLKHNASVLGSRPGHRVRFHVLPNLQFDLLLDEDLVEDFDIFREGAHALLSAGNTAISSLATIIRLGRAEKILHNTTKKISGWARSFFTRKTTAGSSDNGVGSMTVPGATQEQPEDILRKLNELDQLENRQLEWFHRNFAPDSPEAIQEATRRDAYSRTRAQFEQDYRRLTGGIG